MITQGTYTATCANCKHSMIIHVSKESFLDPRSCKKCGAEFDHIQKGEIPNSYVAVSKKKEEKPKKMMIKSQKESFKIWKSNKED